MKQTSSRVSSSPKAQSSRSSSLRDAFENPVGLMVGGVFVFVMTTGSLQLVAVMQRLRLDMWNRMANISDMTVPRLACLIAVRGYVSKDVAPKLKGRLE